MLVAADVMGLYPSIPNNVGLKALKQALDKWEQKKNPTEDVLNVTEFVLKSNFIEFNGNIKYQISGIAIGSIVCIPLPLSVWRGTFY